MLLNIFIGLRIIFFQNYDKNRWTEDDIKYKYDNSSSSLTKTVLMTNLKCMNFKTT